MPLASQAGDLRAEGPPRHVIGSEPPKHVDNYRALLKRVGLVLIGVGVLDIAYMVYCLSHDQGYSSSFNIFAVVAGAFLLRGSLGAVRLVTWFAAFMFAGFVGAIFVLPILMPAGLWAAWAAEFRLDPVGLSISLLVGVAEIALLFWVYKQLRAAPVVAARVAAGRSASPPRLAFILGVVLPAVLAGIFYFTAGGAAGAKAVELAKARYGEGYNYHVTEMRWSNGHVWATLEAYNEHEIKPVQVEWEQ